MIFRVYGVVFEEFVDESSKLIATLLCISFIRYSAQKATKKVPESYQHILHKSDYSFTV